MIATYGVIPNMEDKITIIEGPPPTFELVNDIWTFGISESPILTDVVVTRLRTFNGPSLVERCHRAWRNQEPIQLEYRTSDGLRSTAHIVAARYVETNDGHLLILWLRLPKAETGLELDHGDDADDTDQSGDPGLPRGPEDWSL